MRLSRFFPLCVALWLLNLPADAGAAYFIGLGQLPNGLATSSVLLSRDGTALVVNTPSSSAAPGSAFHWTADTGFVQLPFSGGGQRVSADGTVVASSGSAYGYTAQTGWVQTLGPFNWATRELSADGSVMITYGNLRWTGVGTFDLGSLTGSTSSGSLLHDLSADGSVIVGSTELGTRAFRWTAATGMVNIATKIDRRVSATSASDDGSVIVGNVNMPDGRVPFRWTAETGAQIIAPVLVTQAFFPERDAGPFVSDDGSVVYANLSTPNPIGYRWAADTGWARLDFTLQVNPSGISADGNLIAGSIGSAANREVALWDARHGVRPLRDILVEDYGLGEGLAGWGRLSSLAGISADGSVVAGRGFNPDGVQEAWIAYLGPATVPEPTTIWLAALGLAAAGVIHGARRRFKKQPAKRLSIEPLEDRNFLAADPVLPEWMVTVGSPTGTDLSVRAAAHPSGDVYMTARFNGTVDFDPGPGTAPLTSLGDTDVALARYSPAGVLVWARRIGGGVGADFDRALAIDRLGNAYLAGEFTAFVGPQGQQMPGSIVVKIDNSGNAVWAQSVPTGMAAYEDSLRGLSVDDGDANAANWSVFLVGHFKGTANFGGQTLRSTAGSVDGFVSKLATSSGTYLWTNAIAGSGNQSAIGIDVAKTGGAGLYVSASGATEARFGTTTLGAGHFLAKYDPANGSLVWAKQVANFGEVATDGFNVYVGGTGAGNAAVHAFSSSGDLVWSRPLTGSNAIESMAVSPAGNLYVTGDINTTATFGGHTLTPTGTDGYLAQLDSLGSVISAYVIPDQGEGIAVDANDNVYVSGGFGGPTFDHFPTGDSVRATSGFLDIALLKFSPSAPPIDPTPAIVLFDASPDAVLAGESVTLRVNRVHDPDLRLQSMNFYRDTGSGILEADLDVLIAVTQASAGWTTVASTTGLATGEHKFFAEGRDADGAVLGVESATVFVQAVAATTYNSVAVPRQIKDLATITSTINVVDSFSILDVDVQLEIAHTYDADLDVVLIGPTGTRVLLFADIGTSGDNFTGTNLDDEAAAAIANAAPFTGRFRPQSPLAAFDGNGAAGVWTLEITDDKRKDIGTLNSWAIRLSRAANEPASAPSAPAMAPAAQAILAAPAQPLTIVGRTLPRHNDAARGSITAAARHHADVRRTIEMASNSALTLKTSRRGSVPVADDVPRFLDSKAVDAMLART